MSWAPISAKRHEVQRRMTLMRRFPKVCISGSYIYAESWKLNVLYTFGKPLRKTCCDGWRSLLAYSAAKMASTVGTGFKKFGPSMLCALSWIPWSGRLSSLTHVRQRSVIVLAYGTRASKSVTSSLCQVRMRKRLRPFVERSQWFLLGIVLWVFFWYWVRLLLFDGIILLLT